jgi:hypothetical protein
VSNRTVIVVVAVAAALFAFIYFYDRDRMTTSELEGRKDRVFASLKPEAVDRIEIQGTSGLKIALARDPKPAGADAEPVWHIESPRKLDADGAAVREIVSALDFLVKKRVVVGSAERQKPQYGLDKPVVIASFTARGETTAFRIGGGKGSGDTVYVAIDGRDDELFAVEKEFATSMDKGLDDLRDKHLVSVPVDGALGLTVARAGEAISVSRKTADSPWTISRGGAEMLAAGDQVASLLSDIGNVRADEFIADGAADTALAQYGLDTPEYRISVTAPKGAPLELLLGKPCPTKPGQVYAAVKGTGIVACVSDEIATSAGRPVARFAEMRPLVFADDEIEKITLTRGGKPLVLERDEEKGWVAAGHPDVPLSAEAVAGVLEALRVTRADEVLPGAEAVASLGEAAAQVELAVEAGKAPLKLAIFAADPKGEGAASQLRAQRGGENGALVFRKDLLGAIPFDLIAYRDKTIENGETADVVALRIEGPSPQKLNHAEGVWKLDSPAGIDADGAAARRVAELVAEAKVVRFAAERAEPSHGLATPFAKVTAQFRDNGKDADDGDAKKEEKAKDAKEKTVTLEIGALAGDDGSRFARFTGADGSVFVIDKESVDLVAQPLASRDLLSIDPADLAKIAVSANGGTLTATRDGEEWKADSASVDKAELGRKVGELASLRAIRGEAFGAAVGFDAPALKIEAWTQKQLDDGSGPTVVLFGAKTPDAKENGYTARKAGIAVTMVTAARYVDEVIALVSTASAAATPAP